MKSVALPSSASAYRSPLREAQTAATGERILEAAAALVEAGRELTYARVAARAQVQERTVYRHFPTKGALETALWRRMTAAVGLKGFGASNESELLIYLERSFRGFDARENSVRAMLHSKQGLALRLRENAQRKAMMLRCVAEPTAGLDERTRLRAAAATQALYSATTWEVLRDYWGMDGEEAAATVALAISTLFAGLRARPRRRKRRS